MKIFAAPLLAFFLMCAGNVSAQDSQPVNDNGKMVYEQSCLACHQADGSGVPGLAPPLIKGVFVNGEKERVINIILNGLEGVEIKGETYANPMPAFDFLSDEDIASVLTYVRNNFENKGEAITREEVAAVRAGE